MCVVDNLGSMDLWTVPIPAVATVIVLVYFMSAASARVSELVFDLAEGLAKKKEISSANVGVVRRQLTPGWVNGLGWGSTLASLLVFVYVGMRFGWLWAIGYAILAHLLESLALPLPPTPAQTRAIVRKQARLTAPKLVEKLDLEA